MAVLAITAIFYVGSFDIPFDPTFGSHRLPATRTSTPKGRYFIGGFPASASFLFSASFFFGESPVVQNTNRGIRVEKPFRFSGLNVQNLPFVCALEWMCAKLPMFLTASIASASCEGSLPEARISSISLDSSDFFTFVLSLRDSGRQYFHSY